CAAIPEMPFNRTRMTQAAFGAVEARGRPSFRTILDGSVAPNVVGNLPGGPGGGHFRRPGSGNGLYSLRSGGGGRGIGSPSPLRGGPLQGDPSQRQWHGAAGGRAG